jgi:hypothetical protein
LVRVLAIGFMSKGFGEQLGLGESVKIYFGKVPDLSKIWNWVRDRLRIQIGISRERTDALPSAPGKSAS